MPLLVQNVRVCRIGVAAMPKVSPLDHDVSLVDETRCNMIECESYARKPLFVPCKKDSLCGMKFPRYGGWQIREPFSMGAFNDAATSLGNLYGFISSLYGG